MFSAFNEAISDVADIIEDVMSDGEDETFEEIEDYEVSDEVTPPLFILQK